jgi:hypothetical protein
VHYQGWKSRWDEWLPEDKVHEDNEESRILQVQTYSYSQSPAPPIRCVSFCWKPSNGGPLNRGLIVRLQAKLKAQATFEDKFSAREKEKRKDEDDDRLTLRLNIPHILQKYLLDEGFHHTKLQLF